MRNLGRETTSSPNLSISGGGARSEGHNRSSVGQDKILNKIIELNRIDRAVFLSGVIGMHFAISISASLCACPLG
jgi:hypothetical protein